MHDLSDGFAIPGPASQPKKLANVSATGAQLRNEAGTTYVEIAADGKIKLVSSNQVNVEAPLNVTGNMNITGSLVVSGTVGATEVTAGLIPLSTHKHTGVTIGLGTSGGPVP